MRFSISFAAVAVASCFAVAHASPVDPAQSVARNMMGRSNGLVSWDSQPMERSPADPEGRATTEEDMLITLEKRIVYNPKVVSPTSHAIWHAGQKQTVKWKVNQDDIPAQAKNFLVTVKLGFMPPSGAGGYNLKWTVAKDISIMSEEADFVLPADLETRDDYIVVVMGDSGNRSKKFTIRANKNAAANQAVKDTGHPSVKCSSKPADEKEARDVGNEDVYADHLLGRDVSSSA